MAAPTNTANYTLGRGKMLFKQEGETAYADLGNAPGFSITTALEVLEHFQSRGGLKTKDLEIVTQQTASGTITLDEAKIENLKRFFMASGITSTVQGSGSASFEALTAVHDAWVEIGKRDISNVVVVSPGNTVTFTNGTNLVNEATHGRAAGEKVVFSNSGGALPAEIVAGQVYYVINPNAGDYQISETLSGSAHTFTDDGTGTHSAHEGYTSGTDYDLDTGAGYLYTRSDGGITDSEALELSYDYAAVTENSVKAATTTTIQGDILFLGDPAHGRKWDVKGYGTVKPDGEFSFIGDELTSFTFNIEFLEVSGVAGLFELIDRGEVT